MNGETCNGLGWCVKRDAAPLGEPWCDGAGRCVKGYAAAVNGDDGLREAIARALVTSDADAHGSYAWDECSEELRADYRRYAAAVLALREVAALRAKADAADRVRECIDSMDPIEVALGGLMYVHGEIRRALDGADRTDRGRC